MWRTLPGGHFVCEAGHAGEDPGTEVDSQELLRTEEVDSVPHEGVEDHHVTQEVEGAVVREGGEDHGKTTGLGSQ